MGHRGLAATGAAGLLLVLAACGMEDRQPSGDPTTRDPAGSQAGAGGARSVPAPFRDRDPELEVEDQHGDGTSVQLDEVRLTWADGYVAVYTAHAERLVGHAAVRRSERARAVTVTLSPPVTLDVDLVAVLHADDGNRVFDASTDPRVVDDDLELELERFRYLLRP